MPPPSVQGKIAFVVDETLSKTRAEALTRVVTAIRQDFQIELFPGQTSEDDLIAHVQAGRHTLVLAPWAKYAGWKKLEAALGLSRTGGPAFAGYLGEDLRPSGLGAEPPPYFRAIFLDLSRIATAEAAMLVKALAVPELRSGIRPLVGHSSPVYCETWYSGQGLGPRLEAVTSIPEIQRTEWSKRAAAARIGILALWSLIYEQGPGKTDAAQPPAGKVPRAYFQVGANERCLALRLCYSLAAASPKTALAQFWPGARPASDPIRLLQRHADFLRVHTISDTSDIEVVAGFLASSPSEKLLDPVRSIWIEPLAASLVSEMPYEGPGSSAPDLKSLPSFATGDSGAKTKERLILEAAQKINELRQAVAERDALIRELRSGGVGTHPMPPPPDAEALIDAFQERYDEVGYLVRQCELQIAQAESGGASMQTIEAIRQKIATLFARQQEWIRRLSALIDEHRRRRKAG